MAKSDQIRGTHEILGLDLTQVKELYELEFAAEKLQRIAAELEEKLQQSPTET